MKKLMITIRKFYYPAIHLHLRKVTKAIKYFGQKLKESSLKELNKNELKVKMQKKKQNLKYLTTGLRAIYQKMQN